MSGVENLVSLGDDDSPVSNGSSSPLSPDCSTILDLPMSLDFDPMSFTFTETKLPQQQNEPDIIEISSIFNPNPDLVLIDVCCDANPNTSSASTCSSLEPPDILREQLEDEMMREDDDEYDSEGSSKRNRVIGKKKTLSSSCESSVSEKRTLTTTRMAEKYTEMNGDSKNLVNGKDDESSTDEEEEDDVVIEDEKIMCPVFVPKLENDLPDTESLTPSNKELIIAVDLKSLASNRMKRSEQSKREVSISAKNRNATSQRMQYVQHATQDSLLSPNKEVISTGINLNSLKSSYTQVAQEEMPVSPNAREVISTGVDIKSIKDCITSTKDDESLWTKEADTIDISISVQSLKTSFTKSTEEVETYVSSPIEEVKPSVDRAQVTRKFSQEVTCSSVKECHDGRGVEDDKCLCKICGKHVYQMEKIKAEKSNFHKNCFRCKECNKMLTVDTYSSNEGELYCKPHFRQLFQPKARFDGDDQAPTDTSTDLLDGMETEEGKQRRNEMIIRENTPLELPPDVVRCDTRVDLDLESLPNVNLSNIKSRFESPQEEIKVPSTSDLCTLQRSPSVLARLAKYQSAVSSSHHTNGDAMSSEDELDRDASIVRETQHVEKVVFSGMSSLKDQWEAGQVNGLDEERREENKEELSKLRQRICLGRSESMKQVYEKACQESSKSPVRSESIMLGRDVKALSIKEKFERGAIDKDDEIESERQEKARKEKEEDLSVLAEPGTANTARNIFKQIATDAKPPALVSPIKSPTVLRSNAEPPANADVRCSDPVEKEDISVETTEISEKFKFFENYQDQQPKERKRFQITPPREPVKEDSPETDIVRDPNIVRSGDVQDDLPQGDTAKRMLNVFKALESKNDQPPLPAGPPKQLKRITPPRDYTGSENHHEPSPEPERDPDVVRCSYKTEDDIAVEADKAKSLRAKFENWTSDVAQENMKNEKMNEEDYLPQVDVTKNLRAKFEAIKDENNKAILENPKSKVGRFIHDQSENCTICNKRLYPMERMEASGMKLHKNCFRCCHCNCVLRLENYTTSAGKLFCTPHFKQLFISKGNYDEGFGREQHKEKWNRSRSNTPTPRDVVDSNIKAYSNGTDGDHFENSLNQEMVA